MLGFFYVLRKSVLIILILKKVFLEIEWLSKVFYSPREINNSVAVSQKIRT